jgi:A/G-specific adenine glycosylase
MKTHLSPSQLKTFQTRLLEWFHAHKRDLPWRVSRDPYGIWIAEVMLQQTRIASVLPYYQRFLEKFPTVQSLANGSITEVLRLWSGLGYYGRAHHLHHAAKRIVSEHDGNFPRILETAQELPGIGHYTSAAVLSIAYDVPLAVLDGNVARVLARLCAIRDDLRVPRRWRELGETAQLWLACDSPGDWNQALMELGETVCTPQSPHCDVCPVSRWCQAFALGATNEIPAPRVKRATVHVKIAAAVLQDPQGRTILVKGPGEHDGVLFSRMWQFPAVAVAHDAKAELENHLRTTLGVNDASLEALPSARHGVTFRDIILLPFLASVSQLPKRKGTRILRLNDLARVPISSATRKIALAVSPQCIN